MPMPDRLTSALRTARLRAVLGSGSVPGAPLDHPDDVLRFWFGRLPGPTFTLRDAAWLPTRVPFWGGHWARRLLDVDAVIGRHFSALYQQACRGELDGWTRTPEGRLALIILLDQMGRNMHRGTPAAFAQDGRVLAIVEEGLERGEDQRFNPLARTLFYLPLMHHEDAALARRSVALYEGARASATGLPRIVVLVELASARRHAEILERFGRYPHRNAALGRPSTAEELAFLRGPFTSF